MIYKALFGMDEGDVLLKMLDLSKHNFSRYRGCSLEIEKDDITIFVCTRDGGNNREYAQDTFGELMKHPNYIYDYDDDGDNTYANIIFSVPEKYKELARWLKSLDTSFYKFHELIKELKVSNAKQ